MTTKADSRANFFTIFEGISEIQGLDDTLDVDDPGDGDDARYAQCAREPWSMARAFCVVVTDDAPT